MAKKNFVASSWLATKNTSPKKMQPSNHLVNQSSQKSSKYLPSFLQRRNSKKEQPPQDEGFNPSNFFVEGWTGESLNSKNTAAFITIMNKIQGEIKRGLLKSTNPMTRKYKTQVYEEFISFAQETELNSVNFNDPQGFWEEALSKTSPHFKSIQCFFDFYSLKVAFIYLAKLRFIYGVCNQLQTNFDQKVIIYPNSFLLGVFKKGSRYELSSKSTQAHAYSWFTPSLDIAQMILAEKNLFKELSVSDLIKNFDMKVNRLIGKNTYSHSLSHKSYGLFLNLIMINLPVWLTNRQSQLDQTPFKIPVENIQLMSTKFTGDHIVPLSHSHWLAQENNRYFKWDQLLCSSFEEDKQGEHSFSKISNELIFLSFLLQISEHYDSDFRELIASIINGNQINQHEGNSYQGSFLPHHGDESYNRIILNLSTFPKNNSQHYLIQQIHNQYKSLKTDGTLFVISNKKLFVPSQKDKVQALLEKFQVQSIIQLDELKGKGEVGSFIYVLSKRAPGQVNRNSKESTPVFRFTGELQTFQDFHGIIELIENFFEKHFFDSPAMYQKSNDLGLTIEYFTEAIADGQLIHSSSKDNSKVTHPHYFEKLLRSCHPLSHFFEIETINFDKKVSGDSELNLNVEDDNYTTMPFVLVVDNRTKVKTKLEIIPSSQIESKAYEYGRSLCHYFGLSPKWPNLNIDAVIDYFDSPIGEQIIDITFNDTNKKIKSCVNKVLIPASFLQHADVPLHLNSALSLFESSSDELLNMIPSHLQKRFDQSLPFLNEMLDQYPGVILGQVAKFKRQLNGALETFEFSHLQDHSINFNNPMIKSPLLMSRTYALVPENDEIFVEFAHDTDMSVLHGGLQKTKLIRSQENRDLMTIELYTFEGKVLSMHSHKHLIRFVDFLLSNAVTVPINLILKGIKVPKLNDLQEIINSYMILKNTLEDISKEIPHLQNQYVNKLILNV